MSLPRRSRTAPVTQQEEPSDDSRRQQAANYYNSDIPNFGWTRPSGGKRTTHPERVMTSVLPNAIPLTASYTLAFTSPYIFFNPPDIIKVGQDPPFECFYVQIRHNENVKEDFAAHRPAQACREHLQQAMEYHYDNKWFLAKTALRQAADNAADVVHVRRESMAPRNDTTICHILMRQAWADVSVSLDLMAIRYVTTPPTEGQYYFSNDNIIWHAEYALECISPTTENCSDTARSLLFNSTAWHSRDIEMRPGGRVTPYEMAMTHTPYAREHALYVTN